ncbi:MAG TPA: DUF4384 domain-containing protein [Gemmatimonadales bacterium]|nr:DUF4384 domain-containing protein [Gemmatimonadales bacterium]
MVLPLLFAFLQAPADNGQTAARDARPVRVWLGTTGSLVRGQSVPIFVQAAQDGDLIVLHRRTDGRIEVLFPSNPASDPFVRSGTYEIRGGGNSSAWVVSEPEGSGMVLAALSVDRLRFDEFVRLASWNSTALVPSWNDPNAEGALSDIVQRMLGDGSFDYDLVSYTVAPPIYAQQPLPAPGAVPVPDTLPSEAQQQQQPDTIPYDGSYPVCLNCTFIGYEEVIIAPRHLGARRDRQQDEGICGIHTPCAESQKTHALALPRATAQSAVVAPHSGSGPIPYRSRVSPASPVASAAPRTRRASAPLTHVRYTALSAPEGERSVVLVRAAGGTRAPANEVERRSLESGTGIAGAGAIGNGVGRRAASMAMAGRAEGGATTVSSSRTAAAAAASGRATAGPAHGIAVPPAVFQGAQARVPLNRGMRRR